MAIDPSIISQLNTNVAPAQSFAQTYGQVQQLQDQALTIKERSAQFEQQKQAQADLAQMNQAYRMAVGPDGKFNRDALIANVTKVAPQHVPAILKELDDADKRSAELVKTKAEIAKLGLDNTQTQQKTQEAELDYFGSRAAWLKAQNYNPTAFALEIARLQGEGHDVTPITQAIQSGQTIKNVVDATIQASEKQRQLAVSEKNAQTAADKEPTPTSLQSENVIYKGKPAQVTFNPRTGQRTWTDPVTKQQIDVTGQTTPIPPASIQANDRNTLTDAALDQAAKKYLETGQLPPGQGGMAQRTAIQNRAAQMDPTAALGANQAFFKAQSANLTNLQKTEGTLSAFENTAGKNLDQFLALAESIPDTGVPWLNTPVRMLNQQVVGAANMAAINAARDVALREIARVTNDPKLSGALTDSARAEVMGLSPKNATFAQIKAVAKVLKQDMANVHAGINQEITSVRQAIGAKGGGDEEPDLIWDGAKLVKNPKKGGG